jgi:hypothetical protein
MKERFIISFDLITIHDNICKKDASLHVNYFPYVQICVNIPEDGLSVDRNMQYTCEGVKDNVEFMFC